MPTAVAKPELKFSSPLPDASRKQAPPKDKSFDHELAKAQPDREKTTIHASRPAERTKKAKSSARRDAASEDQSAAKEANKTPATRKTKVGPESDSDGAPEKSEVHLDDSGEKNKPEESKKIESINVESPALPQASIQSILVETSDADQAAASSQSLPGDAKKAGPLKKASPTATPSDDELDGQSETSGQPDAPSVETGPISTVDLSPAPGEKAAEPAHRVAVGESEESPDPQQPKETNLRENSAAGTTLPNSPLPADAAPEEQAAPTGDVVVPDRIHALDALDQPLPALESGVQRSGHAMPARAEAPAPAPVPDAQFATDNHSRIVTAIRGELLPGGGMMHLRLDPPELGALQVTVHMQDGVMTASFQTTSDDATRMLSHSLSQLKHSLELQGVSVEKLHVQQTPREQQSTSDDSRQNQNAGQSFARQDQQRREMLRRMWRRLANGSDPLDMVA